MLRSPITWLLASTLAVGCGHSAEGAAEGAPEGLVVSGSFSPAGPPSAPPTRVNAGGSCIVDVEQPYTITGTLDGSLSVDFRILIDGACGSPPGTFDERWIARGTFTGSLAGQKASSAFSYVAEVKAGGDVSGSIVFGPELSGELKVTGNFADRKLSYAGHVSR